MRRATCLIGREAVGPLAIDFPFYEQAHWARMYHDRHGQTRKSMPLRALALSTLQYVLSCRLPHLTVTSTESASMSILTRFRASR